MRPVTYFPSRLFRWFVSQQILYSGMLIGLINGGLLLWLETGGFEEPTLSLGRRMVLFSFLTALVIHTLVSLFMARRLVVPLGRLIEKTRRLREFPFESEETEPEALTFDEPGEWYELERALNRLGRDLRAKTIRLSREKTELRTIMSGVNEAVLAISADKRVLFYNSQFAYLFRPAPLEGDVRVSQLIRAPDVLEAFDQAVRSGTASRRELQVTTAGERLPRVFQLSVAPLKKKHNEELYGIVGIFHDITELKQADRIRIDFVGNVSHELRTPLTTIAGYVQTLVQDLKTGRTEQALEFLRIIRQNVSRLVNLVDDLLDLSALESGKELKLERVQVAELTEAVTKQVNTRAHLLQVYYDFDQMTADPKRLEQVLRNLMENAVRYVPEGGRIEVSWRRNDGALELHVKDDGPGIAPENQRRIFERFYRVDEARSREKGGTGIGLSLVKHIVQRHGGEVHVHSQPGVGAEFICRFPGTLE